LYKERDITAAFLPHQGQPLAQGLIAVMTLVSNVAFILWCFGCSQDWWQSKSTQFVTLPVSIIASCNCQLEQPDFSGRMMYRRCTLQTHGVD
jgi:hypothetical protein